MASSRKQRPLKERFDAALGVIKSLPKDGPFQPSNTTKLRFYALYKQAHEGPCTSVKPSFWDAVGRAKWEAWTVCGKMSGSLAMQMYVEELQQTVEAMPQTPEVEELLKSIGPYYHEDTKEEEEEEEVVEDIKSPGTNSVRGAVGGEVEGEGKGKEEERDNGGDEDERDGPSRTNGVSGEEEEGPGDHSDSDYSEDFQESFQMLPSTSTQLHLQLDDPLPPTQADGPRVQPDSQTSNSLRVTFSNLAQSAESHSLEEGNPLLSRLISIQADLQSLLHQITTLISSLRPQLNSQPHPLPRPHPQLRRLRRSSLLYRLVPFLLSWPFVVHFFIRFLNKRFGSSTSSPSWVFPLVTFLHTMVAVALFTVTSSELSATNSNIM